MANATNAGMPLTIDGVEYEFSPLTFEDLEFFEMWLKAQAIQAARMAMPEGLSTAEVTEYLRPFVELANEINIFAESNFEKLMTPSGIVQVVKRMLKKHPDVTTNVVRGWFQKRDAIDSIMPTLHTLIQVSVKRGANPKPRPTPSRRKTTARK